MPGTSMTQYPANREDGTEVSSTFEGRHLTFAESEITAPAGLTQKGDPVLIGESIVGVAFSTAAAAGDLIAVDTEGIWNLEVVATEEGPINSAVAPGDDIYIHKVSGVLSKDFNKNTHQHYGYALGTIGGGVTAVIAVKVHWDPDDVEEIVGTRAVPQVSDVASSTFRKYCYEAQGGTEQVGDWLELEITTVACFWAAAMFRRLAWTADQNWITGYSAVAEFELAIAAGAGLMDTCTVIQLNSMIGTLAGTGHNNFRLSWLRMHDYAGAVNEQINIFLELIDQLGNYPAGNNNTELFVAQAAWAVTHSLRIMVNGVVYWIGVSNAS